jgi:Ca-activated chloride channel homolog
VKRTAVFLLTVLAIAAWTCPRLTAQQQKPDKPLFRVGVETVFVKASVTDPLNRYVTGLEREHFRVFEDKVEQTVVHFTQQSAPISVGLLFDVSGSMKENIYSARNSLVRFLQTGNPDDEFFLVTFNHKTALVQSFTNEAAAIQGQVALRQPSGRTALYDAVYMGLDHIKAAKNEKKALILITDGEDNSSRYTPAEVREFAKESDVQIYGIGEEGKLGYGRSEIQNIVALTGGRAFFPNNFNELDYYIDLIHAELRNQYVIGYVPTNKNHDGKWRKIRVKLEPPEGLPPLKVHAKEGYYAPKN